MSIILTLGAVVFALSSIYFIINPKKPFNSAFLVSFVTLISYLLMLQGKFVFDDLYWTRWLFYGISCPLLAFEISKKLGMELPKRIFSVFITFIVMITGVLASISTGSFKQIFFALSSVVFIKLITDFYNTQSKALRTISPYIMFGWSIFPLIFLLSNEGLANVIPIQIAAVIYLGLDIFTKIIFYIHHNEIKLVTE